MIQIKRLPQGKFRCCRTVESTGTGSYDGDKQRCAKPAAYQVYAMKYCAMHAGQCAITYLLAEQISHGKDDE